MEDCNVLKTCFIQNYPYAYDPQWYGAPYLYHNNKSCFLYTMKKLNDNGAPITRLNEQHNNNKYVKQYSDAEQRLKYHLYLYDWSDVMLPPNLWDGVVFHNGSRGGVLDFLYKGLSGPQSGAFTEAVVVQFFSLDERVSPFLPGLTNTVDIPIIKDKWLGNGKSLICRQLQLIISWAYTIHKSQGNNLDLAIIFLGESEK